MEWATANFAALVPILIAIGTGIGILVQRKLSGQIHFEDEASLERTIKLKQLMDSERMTVEEVRTLRKKFRNSRGGIVGAEARAIARKSETAVLVDDPKGKTWPGKAPYHETTAGMATKAGAELDILNGKLRLMIGELAHNLSESRVAQLYEAHDAWETYCAADAKYAALLLEGGTGESLLYAGRMIELTEQRLQDLALYQAEKDLNRARPKNDLLARAGTFE
ncbi:DUF1311 domain-containing protein [Altererythrobacter sp. HHU K3-1]|uniref:DUF1311 domain-containing protein n=1 Tax=Qipengyuania atrilutea TaxID=2744473 RepID=A0A850H125_9SPHN|nr:DUF1311 domain-containing protein [Actirhodobacter atriluteus]